MSRKKKVKTENAKNVKPNQVKVSKVDNSKISKADFVRALPADMPAREAVTKALEAGLNLSENYVYTIRYEAKKGSKKTREPRTAKGHSNDVVDLLRAAASEIGLSRAISILQDQQNTLRAVLGQPTAG